MVGLSNITDAAGLDVEAKLALEQLVEVYAKHKQTNRMLGQYYECKQPTPPIGIYNIPDKVNVPARCDWAAKAVTSVSERVRMNGFTFAGDYRDATLERIERMNGLSTNFNRHVASELVHGCMFATVQRVGDRVAVRTHTAETASAIWDVSENRIACGFVIADSRRTRWSPSAPVPVQVNLHLPRRVVVIEQRDGGMWRAASNPTPLDRPMMEAFCFRPTGTKPFGQSRITPAVRYYVDEVQRTLRYMAVSGALYAVPKDILTGLTEAQFKAMKDEQFNVMVTSLFMATRDPKSGQVPDYKRLQASSPQPYIDSIATYAKLFSGATGVPLNSLGIVQDNPSSAEAIAAQREDICVAAEDCIESNRESMRNVALMAMAVAENKTLDALTDEQLTVMPDFKNPMRPSLASTADAYVKIAGVLDGFASTREFLRGQGFTPSEVESIASQLRRSKAQSSAAASAQAALIQGMAKRGQQVNDGSIAGEA